jgi:hypothetical protein
MKKLIGLLVVSSVLALASSARAHCGSCGVGEEKGAKAGAAHKEGHTCPKHDCCPSAIEGAQTKVTNTADGVTVTVSAKDAAAVKLIQEAAAKMAQGGHKHESHEHGHDHAPKKDAKKKG